MKVKLYVAFLGCLALTMPNLTAHSQTKAALFEGILAAGYVDHGAFINCTGPCIKYSKKPYAVLLGLLPSLRIKEDKVAPGATQNKTVTPNLGFGLTAVSHHIALQVPFYYNTKTAQKDGEWNVGVGLGYRF